MGQRSRSGSCSAPPTASTATSRVATARRVRRVPRSAGRQGARLGAMFALGRQQGVFWWLPVALIAAREVAISMYRSMAGRQGHRDPGAAGREGQDRVPAVRGRLRVAAMVGRCAVAVQRVLWVGVVLTLVTGAQYLLRRRAESLAATARVSLRCEVVAVGTELLLGQIVDTNSSWIGEQLALRGHRLALPDQGRRQPRPHRRGAARSRSTAATR